ncbi:MAG: TlpA disulfide reductase family protein [bacterium]
MLKKALVILFFTAWLVFSAGADLTFNLPNLEGKTVSLADYLGQKITLVSFFTSWSKSCQSELSWLKELNEKYQDSKLQIISISFDRDEKELQAYVAKNKLGFEVLHDKKLTTLKDFKVLVIPTLFVFDLKGKLKNIYVDFDKNVEQAVETELAKLIRT